MTARRGARGRTARSGGRWPLRDQSAVATVLGIGPLPAVGLAFALTAVGVFADLVRIGTVGAVFTMCYVLGCLLAIIWIRRRDVFTAMVQPPLLLAVAIPAVVLLSSNPRPGQGIAERLLVVGAPLVNAFPMMAWATGLTLAVGVARMVLQRAGRGPVPTRSAGADRDAPERPPARRRSAASATARPEPDAAPGEGRRRRSPRRS